MAQSTHGANSIASQSTIATSNVVLGWSGANAYFYRALDMKNIILLNNQSTVTLFVTKIRFKVCGTLRNTWN
jgi:hypothetical protein